MSTKELELIEKQELRDKLIGNVEVLDKVKELILLPNAEVATVKQVASYYEVGIEAINSIIKRNGDELRSDGYRTYTGKEVKDILVKSNMNITNFRGYFKADNHKFANRSNGLFSKRAILRVGMLLRDSEVAKEVRTYLLNIEEKSTDEQKEKVIQGITELQLLQLEVINAPTEEERVIALAKYTAYKNKESEKYKAKVENLTTSDATFTIRAAKNNLGVGERKLVNYLLKNKYCYRQGGNGRLRPYTQYTDGSNTRYFTEIKQVAKNGQEYTNMTLTIEGIEFFRTKVDDIGK